MTASREKILTCVSPSNSAADEIAGLDKMQRAARAKRKDLRLAAADLTQNVVHAVKADPALGENSTMYAALGYVRKSDRYPRRRRVQVSSASLPTEGDTKVQDPSVQKLEEEVKP